MPSKTAPEPTPEPAPEAVTPEPAPEAVATVTMLPNGWHLIEHGTWQVSVDPTGTILLPRHLSPAEAHDFAGAILAAGEVGHQLKTANEELAKGDDRSRPSRRVAVTAGGIPTGAVRLAGKASADKPTARGSIGRRSQRRGSSGGAPAAGTRRTRG